MKVNRSIECVKSIVNGQHVPICIRALMHVYEVLVDIPTRSDDIVYSNVRSISKCHDYVCNYYH